MLIPLAAEIFFEAEELVKSDQAMLTQAGAFAQIYSIFNAVLGIAAMAGPGLAGFFYEKTNWQVTAGVLALLCGCGAIPVFRYTGTARKESEVGGQSSEAQLVRDLR